MNIAILIPSLGGGGAERVAQKIGNHYSNKGNNVYFFLLNDHIRQVYEVDGKIIYTGIEPISGKIQGGMKEFLYRLFCSAMRMRKLKKKHHIDVAISFMEECNYLNILSQRGERVIVRICTILSKRDDMNKYLYSTQVIKSIYSLPCQIVIMSQFARDEMMNIYDIDERKLHIIPNPIEKRHFIQNEERNEMKVITVGRLDPVKQTDRIIRSFAYTIKKVPYAQLIIVGRGDNERYLRNVARNFGIEEKVKFVGFCKDVWNEYYDVDCFVLASRVEGFPNGMVEAMACGIPVVSTDSPGGIADILGEETETCSGYKLCRYGVKTSAMPSGKADNNLNLLDEEIQLGQALADVLNNKKIKEHYSNKSVERSEFYQSESVFLLWDKLIGGSK